MAIYGILFQISSILFLTAFVLWLLSLLFPKKGLYSLFVFFTYPTILTIIISAILALLDENIKLELKFLFMAIALTWGITGRIMESPSTSRNQSIFRFILQFISLIGAWILIDMFFFM